MTRSKSSRNSQLSDTTEHHQPNNTNLKVVKTEINETGEAVQLVRPYSENAKSKGEIVGELVSKFNYRRSSGPVGSNNDLSNIKRAFGENLATELMETYEGSHLISDSQQDLIGETYLAEQIRLIEEEQKRTSILDKWGHLFYEGEGMYDEGSHKLSAAGGASAQARTASQRSFTTTATNRSQNQSQADLLVESSMRSQSRRSQRSQLSTGSRPQSQQAAASAAASASASAAVQSNSQTSMDAQLVAQVQANMLAQVEERRRQAEAADQAYQNGDESEGGVNQQQQQQQGDEYSEAEQNPNEDYNQSSSVAGGPSYSQSQSQSGRSGVEQSQSEGYLQNDDDDEDQNEQDEEEQEQQQAAPASRLSQASKATSKKSSASKNSKASSSKSKASSSSSASSKSKPQQPESYLPSLSQDNLQRITIDAYNSPQFKALLDLVTKPLEIPEEVINYPPEWPVDEKINLLCEPIYIPAPEPIVIPAPSVIKLDNRNGESGEESGNVAEPTVSYFPQIDENQDFADYGIKQLNMDNLSRTSSNLGLSQHGQN